MFKIFFLCLAMLVLSLNSLYGESSGTSAVAPQGKARSIAVAPSRPAFQALAGKSEIRLSDETLRQMRRGTGTAGTQGKNALVPWNGSGPTMGSKSGPVGSSRKDSIIRPVSDQKGDYKKPLLAF